MNSAYVPPIAAGPKTIVCYICGRQYGIHSYDIHLKQCKDLWVAREAQKPLRERKPLPADPMTAILSSNAPRESTSGPTNTKAAQLSHADIAAINAAASETYNTVSLATCPWCGRSFLAEKLVIHNRSCTEENPARRVTDPVKRGESAQNIIAPTTPIRPKTSGGIKERKYKQSDRSQSPQQFSEFSAQLPNLTGRGVTSIEPVTESGTAHGALNSIEENPGKLSRTKRALIKAGSEMGIERSDKAETIRILSQKIIDMEETALSLVQSISEVKKIINQLQK